MRFLYTTATLLFMTAAASQAGTLTFSYNTGSGILAGTLSGTLQGDNNTFVVSSVDSAGFGGSAGPSLPFVDSLDNRFLVSGSAPTVTLDGSFMDFLACEDSACHEGWGFAVGDVFAALSAGPRIFASPDFGNAGGTYSASNWSASLGADAPEPGTLTLGFAAAAFAAVVSRRKRLVRPE